METILMLIAAIAPAVVLGYYIYKKDKLKQEPPKELLKAFGLGALSTVVSLYGVNKLRKIAVKKAEQHLMADASCIDNQ